jgi:crotonobetainyl-CoA hydratase
VNEVVEGDVLEAARRWAAEIQLCSPMSIRATKQAAMRGLSVSTAQGMAEQWEYPAVKAMFASEDVQEGPKAFSEKRMPQWTGAPRRDAAGAE